MASKDGKSVLVIGGSGYVSSHVAAVAVAQGHDVWVVTRGLRPVRDGVKAIRADREDSHAFAERIRSLGHHWDLVIDCVAYRPAHVQQDLDVFTGIADQLVLVSSDMVFDPEHRAVPTPVEYPHYQIDDSYGGLKRQCELVLIDDKSGNIPWTVFRPCHVYGPGWWLGCLPLHFRDEQLLATLRRGEALKLVGGGYFLQHPIYAPDLARLILSSAGNERAYAKTYMAAGPSLVESRQYYEIIADALGTSLTVEEVAIDAYIRANPELRPQLRHRVYDLDNIMAHGLELPATPIETGLHEHVRSLEAS